MIESKDKTHHESAIQHVTGEAVYVGDMQMGEQMLIGRVVYSPYAHAEIVDYDLSEARKLQGVYAVLDHKDIPGINELNPMVHDEPCLAKEKVSCIGQAIFLIAAENEQIAHDAEKKIRIIYKLLPAILSIDEAIAGGNLLAPSRAIETGDPDTALMQAKHVIEGTLKTGGQEHWYLETQSALCVPGEGHEMMVYASSQNPTETQMVVAEVLGINANEVVCEVRRLGGGFGGKETQGNHVAAWAALLANATRRPVKMVLNRDDDQKITGKRHRFQSSYKIGFDDNGQITSYIVDMNADAGMAKDLSMAILERALFHAENAYFIPNLRATGTMWKTNLPSNTAFRGFGGPQGMAVIEQAIDQIARYLKKDAAEIRYKNFYGLHERNITPYGQPISNNRLLMIWDQLIESSNYYDRREKTSSYNTKNEYVKRGLALTPVKFGISFTTSFLNQAGALVLIYKDGTVLVNHGGTEMGQGLHTKIWQIAASGLGLPMRKVKVNATNTSKVPNTSPTAASSGTDLNGMAVTNAIAKLKARLQPCAAKMIAEQFGFTPKGALTYQNGKIFDLDHPTKSIEFESLIAKAHFEQISLGATGFYSTPGIFFDRNKGKGTPFYYFAYGMAVSEVEVDTLTGSVKLLRTDILHDVGDSINPGVDLGQVTGGFIQGVGWCTTETLRYSKDGHLLNHSPDTYKIPGIGNIPEIFNVSLLDKAPNPSVIKRSKAVGEPPFMLAFSVWLAIKDAISAVGNHKVEPLFGLPANNELVLLSIENIRSRHAAP
ncbi:MAG: xanthine dehydrogenase molybdopterin binding subunit [Bacteroidales bacterium]|nr:xanthine dehydrogenase molybdopterin binding subunit [Bacteroidales bacterium]MDZ4203614.1 xanthine dehydrogenase molybdopterin binding subunit [Bacteroidales bacterium]